MSKKKVFITIGCIGVLLLVVGVSYAYWSLTFTQTDNNVVTTDCFEIEFLEGNAINLSKAYPISDEDGLKNIPYTFTIRNVCTSSANYQINLESLIPSSKKLPDQYLKIDLKSEKESLITEKLDKELNSNFETETTIEEAVEAYKLYVGMLNPKAEKTFEIRIWMHSDVTADMEDSMNAEYKGRVSIITSYEKSIVVLAGQKIPLVEEGNGLYMVTHEDANITYTSDEEVINNLKRTEYRYAGSNPNNYVNFNNELWRIIGLVNTPEGQRIKLIRNESMGMYSWNSSMSSINSGAGVNEWSTSNMMELLNQGGYYNRTSNVCYNGQNNATTSCDFSETGLTNNAKEMIDTVIWNLGSNGNTTWNAINTSDFYNFERSNNTGKICGSGAWCNDTITRTTSWIGQVGLMYPSDYGYATSGGVTTDRSTCLTTVLYSWNGSSVSDCKENDWLYKSGTLQWTLTPIAHSSYANLVYHVNDAGGVGQNGSSSASSLQPTVYLKNNVKIESGSGSFDLPYELSV